MKITNKKMCMLGTFHKEIDFGKYTSENTLHFCKMQFQSHSLYCVIPPPQFKCVCDGFLSSDEFKLSQCGLSSSWGVLLYSRCHHLTGMFISCYRKWSRFRNKTKICLFSAPTGSPIIRLLYCLKSKARQFGQGGNPLALEWEIFITLVGIV